MSTRPWSEKTCVVTGATNGLGLVTARELARLGARVIVVGRSARRTQEVVAQLKRETRNDKVEEALCDFSKLSDIRALADDLKNRCDRLDVLVNNVGGIFETRHTTSDGFEMTFAVNHLGYVALTLPLLDLLRKSAPARIVNVSSGAHFAGRIRFDDLQSTQGYSGFSAYAASKLMNILFTRELARRLEGRGVTVNAAHPGPVATNFAQNNTTGMFRWVYRLAKVFMLSPEAGARTQIHLATSPEVEGVTGAYFVRSKQSRISARAAHDEDARRLWEVTEALLARSADG